MSVSRNNGSSTAFASLKDVKEQIKVNLTTAQYLRILDVLLYKSMEEIVCKTRFFDAYLVRLLGWQEKNHRRKISFLDRKHVPGLILTFLFAPDSDRLRTFKNIKLDRGLRVELVKSFLEDNQEYMNICDLNVSSLDSTTISSLVRRKYELEVRYPEISELYNCCVSARTWLNSALEFRERIQQKYIRLTLLAARRDFDRLFSSRAIALDDMVQVYLLACLRAIEKCDSDAGTLTTHIQNWFFTARENIYRGQERALSIDNRPVSSTSSTEDPADIVEDAETQSSAALSLEDIDEDSFAHDSIESYHVTEDAVNGILQAARLADPLGAARVFLGLPEILPPSDIAYLKSVAVVTSTPDAESN